MNLHNIAEKVAGTGLFSGSRVTFISILLLCMVLLAIPNAALADSNSLASSQPICNVKDYGARGDGVTDDADAIQSAIDDCAASGGGTVLFPSPGVYLSSDFNYKDNIILKLDGQDMNDVVIRGHDHATTARFIRADNVSNVGIVGPGTIDRGRGGSPDDAPFWIPFDTWYWKHTIVFDGCDNVTLQDVLITSEAYSVQFCGDQLIISNCRNVEVSGVEVRANQDGSSNDALHITNGGENISIQESRVSAGDDSLVFHGTLDHADYSSISVRNVFIDGHSVQGAVMLTTGGEADADGSWLQDMTFENIVVEDAMSEWSWGHGISFWPRGNNVHYRNITFRNWEMLGHVPTPFYGIKNYGSGSLQNVDAENIIFDTITIHRTGEYPGQDLEGHGISILQDMESVTFRNITYMYSDGERPPQDKLITFRNIPRLTIENFRILIEGEAIPDALDYLEFINCDVDIISGIVGDLNGDERVDTTDVVIMVQILLEKPGFHYSGSPDLNGDGTIDAIDLQMLVNITLGIS